MPIAMLIGALYALSTLARHSEITVLRASGLSTGGLLKTLLQIAGVLAVLTLITGEVDRAAARKVAKQVRLTAISKLVSADFRTGLWVKDDMSFINVRQVTPDGQLRSIRIYEFNKNAELVAVRRRAGEYLQSAEWKLKNVVSTEVVVGTRGSVRNQPEVLWKSALNPDILGVLLVRPEAMSLLHLTSYIKASQDNKQKTQRYEIALEKAIYPLAVLVMIALALPFGYTHNRVAGGQPEDFCRRHDRCAFHMLKRPVFSNLGAINSWPPLTSAAAPSLMFGGRRRNNDLVG